MRKMTEPISKIFRIDPQWEAPVQLGAREISLFQDDRKPMARASDRQSCGFHETFSHLGFSQERHRWDIDGLK